MMAAVLAPKSQATSFSFSFFFLSLFSNLLAAPSDELQQRGRHQWRRREPSRQCVRSPRGERTAVERLHVGAQKLLAGQLGREKKFLLYHSLPLSVFFSGVRVH